MRKSQVRLQSVSLHLLTTLIDGFALARNECRRYIRIDSYYLKVGDVCVMLRYTMTVSVPY